MTAPRPGKQKPDAQAASSPGAGQSPDAAPWLEARARLSPSCEAALVAALLAVDPAGLGGAALRGPASDLRSAWLQQLRDLLPAATPLHRLPLHATDTALLGGLDLAATLQAGRAVAQQGLLARADGGLLLLGMAERTPAGMAAHLAAVLDQGEVVLERDGLTQRRPARLALLAFDEGQTDDEQMPAALLDRLAFALRLDSLDALDSPDARPDPADDRPGTPAKAPAMAAQQDPADKPRNAPPGSAEGRLAHWQRSDIEAARVLLPRVSLGEHTVQALCAASIVLGVSSLRAPLLALRVARAAAALTGESQISDAHTALAARLVLAPRATQLPAESSQQTPPETQAEPPAQTPAEEDAPQQEPANAEQAEPPPDMPEQSPDEALPDAQALQEIVVQAAMAALAPGLLAALKAGELRAKGGRGGRSGALQKNQLRGRPLGARRGEPRAGARLHVLDTLRAAAPWQKLRQAVQVQVQVKVQVPMHAQPAATALTAPHPKPPSHSADASQSALPEDHRTKDHRNAPASDKPGMRRIQVRREDFHVMRFRQNRPTTTLFVVDASGSSALHRLAEAKGAVELLLADCYVRRDRVAVLAFRGQIADLLLPPTRSLARAKRSLAALPGGGGTPLATGMDAARELAGQIGRQGETPVVVLLTDGRANIARDGTPGRAQAGADALHSARQFRLAGLTTLLIDTSPQPQAVARALAEAMGAAYVPLPFAGAQGLSQAVRLASGQATAAR